jgi:uncharacterized heparinase superfamily protein
MKPMQAIAQVRHTLFGLGAPFRLEASAPTQAVHSAATDFLPPSAHIRASRSGAIELLGTAFEFGERPEWKTTAHGPLFAYHLHQHEYLRTEGFDPQARAKWMLDWIGRHPVGVGWDPHPICLRLLCWGKMLMTPGSLELAADDRDSILASMADQAETLSRGLEFRLQANHLLSNLLSVVWAGILLDGSMSAAWRDRSSMLIDEIERQILPDGGHEERSPMYHSLLLENLLDLLNLCRAESARAPAGLVESLESAASRMVTALRTWTHPDGDIALFADSAFDIASRPAALLEYATRLGVDETNGRASTPGSVLLPQSGYVRLEAEDAVLIASIAGPAPPHQPGHAHCDALAFELSFAGHRFITDTGLFEYRAGDRRHRARTTAAHSTLQIDGQEQAEIWSAHRVGGRPVVELVGWDGESEAEATCRGWSRRNTTHRRTYRLVARGLTIIDEVEGPHEHVRLCLPVDPAWRIELDGSSSRAIATRAIDGSAPSTVAQRIELELPTALEWNVERGPYYPSFGREVERDLIVGRATGFQRSVLRISLGDD